MLAKLLGFFSGGSLAPWAILGGLAMVVGSFGAGVYFGHHYGWLQQEAAVSSASEAVIATTRQQSLATEQADEAFTSQQAKSQIVTQTIVKKVPVYVTKNANTRCVIPVGFVRLHDAAAGGVPLIPGSAGQPDAAATNPDAASGNSLSDVASTVTNNYGTCHQIAQQLIDLQAWVSQQQAIGTK
jgi:hypothetical protein